MWTPGRCCVLRQIAGVEVDGLLLAGPTLNNQVAADGGGRGNTDNEHTRSRFHHGVPPKGELLAAEGQRLKTIYPLRHQGILIAVNLRSHTVRDVATCWPRRNQHERCEQLALPERMVERGARDRRGRGGRHRAALDVIRRGAARVVEVTDAEVEDAMRAYFIDTHQVAEGAGAAPLAALLKEGDRACDRAALILSGGNVDRDVYSRILSGGWT